MANLRPLIVAAALLMSAALSSTALAATYYVATDGNNADAGTATYTAWATIDYAASTAVAGDTVYIRGGTYREKVAVDNSGNTAGSITFAAYPGERPWVDLTGLMASTWDAGWQIVKKDYIAVEGISFSGTAQGIPVRILGANHVTIADAEVNSCIGYGGITAESHSDGTPSTHITFQRNYVHDIRTSPYEAMWIRNDVEYFQILDNIVTRFDNIGIDACGQHTLFSKSPRKGVIRGNHVSDGSAAVGSGARGIYLDGPSEILVEGNTVTACEMGIGASTEAAGDTVSAVIIRKNITYLNRSGNIQVGATTASKGTASQIAVYNCDSIGVTPGAWAPGFKTGYLSGLIIIKNCVSYLFATSSLYHVYMTQGGYGDSLTANCNTFYPDGNRISDKYGNRTTLATHKAFWSVAGQDANSINTEPMLTNTHTASYDFTPLEGSPLIDTGTWLATVAGGNTGTTFSVDKAWPFYAGYGSGEAGDWIRVGTNVVQQITAIDPISNSITVRNSIAVADGDHVWYNYTGSAPDIGYEDADTPTPTPTHTPTYTPTPTATPTATPTPSVRRFQHRQRRWPKWIKVPGKGEIRG